MPIGNGGIIGPANVPTITTASGVWSLREQQQAQGRGAWPLALAPDPYFEYTTLLLPGNGTNGAQNNTFLDGSTNNFTITRNGNTTQGTFSPFSQTGWGNYFDGSGDWLTFTGATTGSGNFTTEAWVYLATLKDYQVIFDNRATGGTATGYAFGVDAAGKPYMYTNNAFQILSSIVITANSWNHVALVRNGTTITIYVNGVSGGTYTSSANFSDTNNGIGIAPTYTPSSQFFGYISNLRIVNGTAVYTSAFTPPTAPLTAISGTSLLTCQSNRFIDNSTNNFTITRNGDVRVVAFSPFNPTASWSAATYGGSGYFDGSGDYLSTPNVSALRPGASTNPFSIECWVYPTVSPSTDTAILGNFKVISYPGNCDGLDLLYTTTRTVAFRWGYPNYSDSGVSPALNINTWNHIVICRNASGSMSCFLNGARWFNTSSNTSITAATAASFWIGWAGSLSGATVNPFPGYISGTKFLNGSTDYDPTLTTLTIPSLPPTNTTNTSLLLNFTNAGIYDATSKNDLETVGNAQISTTQSKWGGSSISFDGTGDWLLIPDQPPQRIGTGNFTVEMWVYRNSSGTYGLAGKGTGTTGWLVSLNSSNQVVFTYGSSTITSSGTVSATTWTHIAVVREGTSTNQTKIYISGTNDGTGTVSTDFNQTNSMYIGADRTGGSAANAYVQDVRITNYARYTSNFTAPTAAFPTL